MEALLETRPAEQRTLVFRGTGEFYGVLKESVDAYFGGRSRRDDVRLYFKAAILTFAFLGVYACILLLSSGWVQAPLCALLGVLACGLGFNVFHDSIHGSFSDSPKMNLTLAKLSCAVFGVSRYLWWYKHNVLHHRFTNVYQWDDDLETRDSLRMSPRQPWKAKFRGQHLYFWALYAMTTLEWVIAKDYVQYFTLKINPFRDIPPMSAEEKQEFWVSKAFYVCAFVLLPIAVAGPLRALAGLLIFHFTLSLCLAFIFNLAHVMEPVDFPEPESSGASLETQWAAHQMRTTVNFATGNRALTWFSGGLNHQIEHHLFPCVSHVHYPALSKIVRETAAEYDLPYNDYPNYAAALKSHVRILRKLGEKPSGLQAA